MSDLKLRLEIETTYDSNSSFDYADDIQMIYPSEGYTDSVVEFRVANYQLIISIDKLSQALSMAKTLRESRRKNKY